ncbi:single-stranded DNA-binding protein [Nocardia sp. NPDC001965]
MNGDTILTLTGNLAADVELRFTPAGHAVANFTVVSTPQYFDRAADEYRDAEPVFMRCTAWRETAENLAESVTRGSRVIVTGRLKQRRWQTQDGQNRSTTELEVGEVGPSLRYATAKVHRTSRRSTGERNDNSGSTSRKPVGAAGSTEAWSGAAGF